MLQFIVLLAIMALWALTSLLSREAQPLPPRRLRGALPDGPRPATPGGRGDALAPGRNFVNAERVSATMPERKAPDRWSETSPAARPAIGRGSGADDGIVILESDNRAARSTAGIPLPAGAVTSRRGSPSRRSTRGRAPAGASPPKQVEPGKPRALTTLVAQSMAQKRNKRLEIAPLAMINSPLSQVSAGAQIEHPGSPDSAPAFTSDSLRKMLASPTKLREVALLTELLQAPIALRHARRLR
jgi:hypothetical protein